MEYVRKTARYNGKKYEATGKTELEALQKLAAAKRGEDVVGGSMTVDAWYKEWKALYKEPKGLTPKSLGMYDEKYRNYIKPRIGRLKLRDVRDVHLQRILNGQVLIPCQKAPHGDAGDVQAGPSVPAHPV